MELTDLILRFKPRAIAICMGYSAAAYRVANLPSYKSNRPPKPKTLTEHFALVPRIYASFGWEIETTRTLEADDLLYSISRAEAAQGGQTLIVTQDNDLLMAASARTRIVFLGKGSLEVIGPNQIEERFGIQPTQLADYIALVGDRSDCIAGVAGIGPKAARQYLQRYGTLENAIFNEPKLAHQADHARLYREIAQLRLTPVIVPKTKKTNWEQGIKALEMMGFHQGADYIKEKTCQKPVSTLKQS